MTIEEIYQKYTVPPNLQQHMLQVAGVGNIIAKNWKNKYEVNEKMITQTLLIHDVAKIVNFNDLEPKTKEQFIQKYGSDEEKATLKIAKELNLEEKGLYILDQMWRIKAENKIPDHENELKICWYADWRVAPYGVTDIHTRIDELIKRSQTKGEQEIKRLNGIKIYCIDLEKELLNKTKINLTQINQLTVDQTIEELMKIVF